MGDSPRAAGAAEASASVPVVDWFEREGSLSGQTGATVARVLRRAGRSWPLWVMGALVISGLVARSRMRREFIYEARVVLRVAEGADSNDNSILSLGDLRDQIDELAFSRERIVPILKKYKMWFDKAGPIDAPEGVAAFRDLMTVTLAENDFMEDDQSSRERRSARVAIAFRHPNNERAYLVAHDLADLVINSGYSRQKKILDAEAQITHEQLAHAAADLARIRQESAGDWGRPKPAVERFAEAQKEEAAAALALRALEGRQALGFEIVDPGRVPALIDRRDVMITSFFFALFASLIAGSLLAGVFDPRVLDGEDLAALGVDVLGRVPRLPAIRRPPGGGGEQPAPRV